MKNKVISYILIFSLFFMMIMSFPLKVNASFQPPVLPDSSAESAVSQMGNLMLQQMFEHSGIQLPKGIEDYRNAYHLLTGKYTPIDNVNFDYLSFNGVDTSSWSTIYDSHGNVIPWNNITMASGTSSDANVYFLYNNLTGEILYTSNGSGGYETTLNGKWTDNGWNEFYNVIMPISFGQTNAIMPADISADVKEFVESSEFSAYMLSADHSYGVVVTNTCSPNCVIDHPSGYTFQGSTVGAYYTAFNIFCNDTSMVYWSGWNSMLGFNSFNGSYYGHNFQYVSKTYNVWNPMFNGGWIYYHAPTADEYNHVLNELGSDYDDNVYYIIFVEPYDISDTVNYDKLLNQHVTRNYNYNTEYNISYPTTINNYPITINNTSVPDYSPTINYYTTINNYYNSPQINDSDQELNDDDLTNNIPILSNLQKRFPFSIPWDLKSLFDTMSVTREAPHFHWELYIPYIDYTWVIDIDFSIWDTQV